MASICAGLKRDDRLVAAGHVLSRALLTLDHCTASISTSSCPLLQCLHQWHSSTLLSTYYHFLRKPNWRAGLHDRYKCLSDQTCFGFLVSSHVGSLKKACNLSKPDIKTLLDPVQSGTSVTLGCINGCLELATASQ